jgi:ABC-2 type transport system permease protein
VTPVRRLPLIAGRVGQNLVQVLLQSLVIVALALAIGVSFPGGVLGVAVLLLIAGLLGTAFAALSNALALVARKEESLIGAVTFLQLPLVFLSTAFMQPRLLPDWIGTVSDFNPVDWAIVAGREAVDASTDWASVAGYCGLLVGFAVVCLALATKAFGAYQEQV